MADISYFQNEELEDSNDGMEDEYDKADDQQGINDGNIIGHRDEGPQFTPLDRLYQHAFSEKPAERQMVGKLLINIFQNAVKTDRCVNVDTVFQPVEHIIDDPESSVRSSLVECLPHIALFYQESSYLFGKNLTSRILNIILIYIRDQDNQVRQDAQTALRVLLERDLLDSKQIKEDVCNVIVELAHDESPEFQTLALTLMTKVNPYIGNELAEKLFLDQFLELCQSEGFFVRRVCASIMGEFCTIMSTVTVYNKLLQTYANLCLDNIWGVRKTSVDVMMSVARCVPRLVRRVLLSKLLVRHLRDDSRWVRRSAYEILGPFISTFAKQFHELICDQKGELVLVHENERGWPIFNVVPVAKDSDILKENLTLDKWCSSDEFDWKYGQPLEDRLIFLRGKYIKKENKQPLINKTRDEYENFNLFKYYYNPPDMPLDPELVSSIIGEKKNETNQSTEVPLVGKWRNPKLFHMYSIDVDPNNDQAQDNNDNTDNHNEQRQDSNDYNAQQQPHEDNNEHEMLLQNKNQNKEECSKEVEEEQEDEDEEEQEDEDEDEEETNADADKNNEGGEEKCEEEEEKNKCKDGNCLSPNKCDNNVIKRPKLTIRKLLETVRSKTNKSDLPEYSRYIDFVGVPGGNETFTVNETIDVSTISLDQSSFSNVSFSNLNNIENDEDADEIVPRVLIDHFVSMADSESSSNDVGPDLDYHCAFSFPAVVLTLGKENWYRLKDAYRRLASAVPWKVRSTLASSIHEIAIIIEAEYTARDLVPIFNGFIKDLDEVKIGALKHFATFLEVLHPKDREQYLEKLDDFLATDSKWNWRLKEELVKQLSKMLVLYQHNEVATYIAPMLLDLMQDRIAAVRLGAIDGLVNTIAYLFTGSDTMMAVELVQCMRQTLIKRASERWIIRQTYAIICSKIANCKAISGKVFAEELLPYLLELSFDKVPNVRLVVARTLARDVVNIPDFAENFPELMTEVQQKLSVMQTDCDRDVRIFASQEFDPYS